MSAYGMKPHFTDYQGYSRWRSEWSSLYMDHSLDVRRSKLEIKALNRIMAAGGTPAQAERLANLQRELRHKRVMGHKLMTLLNEAKIRWQNIRDMKRGVNEQLASFPLEVGEARNIDFHFNKKHLEFDFIPMWTLKVKGKTFYVNHVDCNVPWTTRETPDNATTKGAIRIKRGTVNIDKEGVATIS